MGQRGLEVNKIIKVVTFFLAGYFIGYYGVKLAYGEVNIAEVEGKYQEPDRADLVQWANTRAVRLSVEALQLAYQAGYIQALHDYNIEESSETYKQKNER